MKIYTVYMFPSDYPDKYVVREFENDIPKEKPTAIEDTLKAARAKIPEGLFWIGRDPKDDPSIIEVWI